MFDKQCLVVLEQKHEADTQNMESLELLENKLDRMAQQLCIELNDAEQYSRNNVSEYTKKNGRKTNICDAVLSLLKDKLNINLTLLGRGIGDRL